MDQDQYTCNPDLGGCGYTSNNQDEFATYDGDWFCTETLDLWGHNHDNNEWRTYAYS